MGLPVSTEGTLAVVLIDDIFDPSLAAVNRSALRTGRPWVLAQIRGASVWMTLFVPGRTACWACLTQRLRHNGWAEGVLEAERDTPFIRPAHPALPAVQRLAGHRVALEAAQWIVRGSNENLEGKLLTLDTTTWAEERHTISRLPHCPACGTPFGADREPESLVLVSRPKTDTQESGYRTLSAEEAFKRYAHLISPLTGVVRDLRRIPTTNQEVNHTYVIQHPLVTRIDSIAKLWASEQRRSGGKGRTEAQAKASALFEALERLSGVWRDGVYRITASYNELGEAALHPDDLSLFSERQYATRRAWNASHPDPTLHVPEPFDPDEHIEWVPVWSLADGSRRYIPAAYAFYDYPLTGRRFCKANSNGCAAGVVPEEAVLQALFELIERDALSLWWYNRIPRPEVDLDSFDDPYFRALRASYHQMGRILYVLDVTADLGIPVFVAVSRQVAGSPNWILGFGCHLDARIAVSRALTEVNQLLPKVLHEAEVEGPNGPAWTRSASPEEAPYLLPDPRQAPRTAAGFARHDTDDLLVDIKTCVARLRGQGLEAFVLDQTNPEIGVPVVRVIIPRLYHYWRRLGGTRLYEVPVELGWIDAPRTEATLNLHSITT